MAISSVFSYYFKTRHEIRRSKNNLSIHLKVNCNNSSLRNIISYTKIIHRLIIFGSIKIPMFNYYYYTSTASRVFAQRVYYPQHIHTHTCAPVKDSFLLPYVYPLAANRFHPILFDSNLTFARFTTIYYTQRAQPRRDSSAERGISGLWSTSREILLQVYTCQACMHACFHIIHRRLYIYIYVCMCVNARARSEFSGSSGK